MSFRPTGDTIESVLSTGIGTLAMTESILKLLEVQPHFDSGGCVEDIPMVRLSDAQFVLNLG